MKKCSDTPIDLLIYENNKELIKLNNLKGQYGGVDIDKILSAKQKDGHWYSLKQDLKTEITLLRLNNQILRAIKLNGIFYKDEQVQLENWFNRANIIKYFDYTLDELRWYRHKFNKFRFRINDIGERGLGARPFVICFENIPK